MSERQAMPYDSWPREASPFHPGERAIQDRLGLRPKLEAQGRRIIHERMPQQHRDFFESLPFLAVGGSDREGRIWASLLSGRPGFVTSPDDRQLVIAAEPPAGDPLADALIPGAPLGLLGLEFETRRRNRANVRIERRDARSIACRVEQSFGNCPKFIQARRPEATEATNCGSPGTVEPLARLDDAAAALITEADTFFVASYAQENGARWAGEGQGGADSADVSHRGGKPGFVKLDRHGGRDRLTVPDFSGNKHFNTLGNFLVTPKAGLTFVDFDSGDLLMMSGGVEILWDDPEVRAFTRAERAWRFTPERSLRLRRALPLRWHFEEASPHSLKTGDWTAEPQV